MRRITRATPAALVLLALAAGCGKKTMDTPPPVTPPAQTLAPELPPTPPPAPPEEPKPVSLSLNDIYFDYDSATLSDGARTTLTDNGRQLTGNTASTVTIEGHCDERGTVDYNLALGEKRARAARDYLVSLGTPAARLRIISDGKERPADPGHDEDAWATNRRAEFVFLAE